HSPPTEPSPQKAVPSSPPPSPTPSPSPPPSSAASATTTATPTATVPPSVNANSNKPNKPNESVIACPFPDCPARLCPATERTHAHFNRFHKGIALTPEQEKLFGIQRCNDCHCYFERLRGHRRDNKCSASHKGRAKWAYYQKRERNLP